MRESTRRHIPASVDLPMEERMKMRKRVFAACLVAGAVLGTAGQAVAHAPTRADGVCGGTGQHYNFVTGECEDH